MNSSTDVKILSIIVPTYNMEKYLGQCLGSVTESACIDKLDVIVVNDGSSDSSSDIAHSFAARFPGSVSVIDKENGHYGSCVNAGLAASRGRYVKVLDADDYVDSQMLHELVSLLSCSDKDLVICQYVDRYETGKSCVKQGLDAKPGESYNPGELLSILKRPPFHAAVFYKLEVLQSMCYRQLTNCLYTDLMWTVIPLGRIRSAVYYPLPVYQYRHDRPGQSLSPEVRARHFGDELKVRMHTLEQLAIIDYASDDNKALCQSLAMSFISGIYREVLVRRNYKIDRDVFEKFDAEIGRINSDIYAALGRLTVSRFVPVRYVAAFRYKSDSFDWLIGVRKALISLFRSSVSFSR